MSSLAAPTPASDRALVDSAVSRARWRLVPFLILMYMLAYLDRANIGFAKQAYQAATGVSDAAFALGAGIFFLTYAVFEVPSNLMLHRMGARRWLSRIMVSWGLAAAAMIFAQGDVSFSAVRLVLGATEAGLFPGVILYLTYWFPAAVRGRVMGVFYFGSPLALMFGGPISGALLDLDGLFGLQGWQLMFLIEGLAASAAGIWAYFYLTDRPSEAAWLTSAERDALGRVLAAEERAKQAAGRVGFAAALRDPRLLHFAAIYFLIQIASYGVAFYLPSVVSTLLHVKVGVLVGFVSAIPWACALVAGATWPGLAERFGRRRLFTVISLLGIAVGLVASANLPPVGAIAAFCVVTMGIMSSQPIFWTFPTSYLGGLAAAGGLAGINAIGNLGGFFAPTVKTAVEAQFHSASAGLYLLAGSGLLAALLAMLLPSRRRSAHTAAGRHETI